MIKVENLTKSYHTPAGRRYVFRDSNLETPSGKNVAFIDRNGAGKSTLLRMIGDIDRPGGGEIIINKTISRPVGLAGGFQGSLTGHEDVKFVTRLYMKQKELKEKIEFVEEFVELGKYFDMPIKTYSSGMRPRLGFGLSVASRFNYYIVGEVTTVGDTRFRERYAQLFKERYKKSSFLMISHDLNSLKEFCDMTIVFKNDNVVSSHEDIQKGIEKYKNNIIINTY